MHATSKFAAQAFRFAAGLVIAVVSFATPRALRADDVTVDSLSALRQAVRAARPGDRIVLADGQYDSPDPIPIAVVGTRDQPIVIAAQSIGGANIRGPAGFRLTGSAAYVVIVGFVFTHEDALEIDPGVHHCRLTRNEFALAVRRNGAYLSVAGDDLEIDHNEFRDKQSEGQMLSVQGPGSSQMAQRAWIHHNYFHDFQNSRRNNSSALHIGHSARSMTSAHALVEHNLFVRTEGENEGGICNKSSDNIYRFNTLGERSSELSLRHGKRCLVYGNFFLGGHGLRFYGHDHRIYSNYFENCRPAISIGNGGDTIPPGPLTSHERPERVHIVYNTLFNNRANVIMEQRRRGLGANDLVFANNLIVGGNRALALDGPLENPHWQGNILWANRGGPGDIPDHGYRQVDPGLTPERAYRLPPGSPAQKAGAGDFPYVTLDVEGQPRSEPNDVGADQRTDEPAPNHVLTESEVGPQAPDDNRRLIFDPFTETATP